MVWFFSHLYFQPSWHFCLWKACWQHHLTAYFILLNLDAKGWTIRLCCLKNNRLYINQCANIFLQRYYHFETLKLGPYVLANSIANFNRPGLWTCSRHWQPWKYLINAMATTGPPDTTMWTDGQQEPGHHRGFQVETPLSLVFCQFNPTTPQEGWRVSSGKTL